MVWNWGWKMRNMVKNGIGSSEPIIVDGLDSVVDGAKSILWRKYRGNRKKWGKRKILCC